jgi:hypothetical protein
VARAGAARERIFELRCGNMWECGMEAAHADIVLLHTEVPAAAAEQLRATILVRSTGVASRIACRGSAPGATIGRPVFHCRTHMFDFLPAPYLGHRIRAFTLQAMRPGCRFVTYDDAAKAWGRGLGAAPSLTGLHGRHPAAALPFVQLPANVDAADTFHTSWSAVRGHHLYCWQRLACPPANLDGGPHAEESKDALP